MQNGHACTSKSHTPDEEICQTVAKNKSQISVILQGFHNVNYNIIICLC